jgi:hypothetical protein
VVDPGRRGGDSRVGERMGVDSWSCLGCAIDTGAVDRGVLAEGAVSGFRVVDRRGGGTLGFILSSSSCTSFADLKDAGDDGACSLSTEVDSRRCMDVERLRSSDFGRDCREPLCGGTFGGGEILVFNDVN